MGINPISELSGQFSTFVSTKKTEAADFQSFMEDASTKSKMNDPYMDDLPVATKSDNEYDSNKQKTDDDSTVKVNKNSDSLSTDHKDVKKVDAEATKELKDKIIDEAAKELGVSEEDIENVLSQLGIGAADLLNTENISLLVANIACDGDVAGLLTDENAANMVLELSQITAGLAEETASAENITVDFLKDALTNEEIDALSVNNVDAVANDGSLMANSQLETENESTGEQSFAGEERDTALDRNSVSHRTVNEESIAEAVTNASEQTVEAPVVETSNSEIITESSQIDTIDIINQIQDHVRAEFKDDMTELQMQLNPENLGTVNLTVAAKESGVTAQLFTQSESVQAALESQIALLRESLENQGVKVEAIEVMVGSHGFEQNLEQGNDFNEQQEEENERLRRATRKIDLGSFAGDEVIEELDESEQVTARMMQADGNQMDYKV
ncbi:MAG: flagellar hook-length control protein FliK [Lachnospiraceae bacterium]|nr:flagellar hook-length control protein FliK [Lachnospiraceae bacterium]